MASNSLPPNVARSVKLILISLDNPKPVKRVEALQELQKLLSSAGLTEKQEVYEQVKTVLYGVSDASIAQELSKLQCTSNLLCSFLVLLPSASAVPRKAPCCSRKLTKTRAILCSRLVPTRRVLRGISRRITLSRRLKIAKRRG